MPNRYRPSRWAFVLACISFTLNGTHAQEVIPSGAEQKSMRIVRVEEAPTIDGVLDDAAWSQAAVIDDLHEIQPTEYAEPSERTVIYVTYDDNALYVAARLFDREPELITARISRQGEEVFGDDWFSVIIDPFNDRRSGYRFLTNPNGLRQEGLFQNVTDTQWEWQGIWYTAGSIDSQGWVTEISIPFKSISFNPASDTWGINFRRAVARRDERMGWVSRNRNTDPSVSGLAVGFEGLQQGRGLDVVPSVSATREKDFSLSTDASDLDPSLDVFYKITPGITGSLTINTDFSATEIDDRQVNLTRFSLFFPEKRDFFLQDSDIFEFGAIQENGRPFFSRTIGLSSTGEPVDLDVGGKLSGRIGRFNIGALAIRQEGFEDIAPDNAVVARVSANVLAESGIGLIVTEGSPNSNLDNSLVGVDFSFRNTRLPGGRVFETHIWNQQSSTEGLTGNDRAYGVAVQSPNSTGIAGGVHYTRLEENFNPGLGFVNRTGIEGYAIGTEYRLRPAEGLVRSILFGVDAERIDTIATSALESEEIDFRLVELESRQGDQLQLRRANNREVLTAPFEISPGVIIPVGDYSFADTSLELSTADQRKVWGGIDYTNGEFYDGDRFGLEAAVAWRPSGRFLMELGYEFNDIDLPHGSFVTRLARFRADVVFSPKLSWVTLLQYDNVSEILGLNLRLHWVPEPGQDGYVVINHNLEDPDRDDDFHSLTTEAAIKFSYTFRF